MHPGGGSPSRCKQIDRQQVSRQCAQREGEQGDAIEPGGAGVLLYHADAEGREGRSKDCCEQPEGLLQDPGGNDRTGNW